MIEKGETGNKSKLKQCNGKQGREGVAVRWEGVLEEGVLG